MGQINKIPLGYLNMLGSQTGGRNPFDASEIVLPNVDLVPFYHAHAMRALFQQFTPTGINSVLNFTVPANKSWFLYACEFQSDTTTNGDEAQVVFRVRRLPKGDSGVGCAISSSVRLVNTDTSQDLGFSAYFDRPIPLTAGAEIQLGYFSLIGFRTTNFSILVAEFDS